MKNRVISDNMSYPLILDGGLSNVLEGKGCDLNHALWTAETMISNPEAIVQAHLDYLHADAQFITTSGYQASIQGFKELGFENEEVVKELISKPVELAYKAVERYQESTNSHHEILIAASIGPYGAYLADGSEYKGNYGVSDSELINFHLERLSILNASSADVLAFETVPSFQEAIVLVSLLKESQKPAWLSFSCKDAAHLNDGTLISKVCELIAPVDSIFGIGVNCTAPRYISELIRQIKTYAPSKKIVIYPNSGEVFNPANKTWSGISDPEDFASQAMKWVQEGADIIGGCCRIGPDHIDQVSRKLSL